MNPETPPERRGREDRRKTDLPIWHPRRLSGRRIRNRRAKDDKARYLVDRVSLPVFVTAFLLLVLTLADGLMTVALLEYGYEEANPVMRVLLERGTGAFFFGKYLLTAAFLPIALVANRYRLFGTPLRVGHLLPVLVAIYVALVVYQLGLWSRRREGDGLRVSAPGAAVPAGAPSLASTSKPRRPEPYPGRSAVSD